MRIVTVLAAAAFIAGCANTGGEQLTWNKPGATEQDFHADRAQCMKMARSGGQPDAPHAPPAGDTPAEGFSEAYAYGQQQRRAQESQQAQQQIFNDCMMGEGWRPE